MNPLVPLLALLLASSPPHTAIGRVIPRARHGDTRRSAVKPPDDTAAAAAASGGGGSGTTPPLSIIQPAFELCMEDVGKALPINKTGAPVVHHYIANTGLWNEGIRFDDFVPPLPPDAVIVEVGGNTDAADSRTLRARYPGAAIHIYEPVPPYFAALDAKWRNDTRATVHGVGLGHGARDVPFATSALDGEGTYLMESLAAGAAADLTIKIVDAAAELQRVMAQAPRGRVDLLHVNCEGCEWELLASLWHGQALALVTHVQVSFHNYSTKGIGAVVLQYCRLREMMAQSHALVAGVPFGWERWTVKSGASGD